MKDLHSHILNGIDDGSKTLEDSLNILKKLSSFGTTDIFLTPHYIEQSEYSCNNKSKKEIFDILQQEVKRRNININLYLGNEIYLTENIHKLVIKKEIHTLNNSRYILVEFPMTYLPINTINIIEELVHIGYKVIIAHPERYSYVKKDIHILDELLEMGVLLQGNYASLFNKYGNEAKKTLKKLLKLNLISFLGSDTHRNVSNIDEKLLRKTLKKYISKEKIDEILDKNYDEIINNR